MGRVLALCTVLCSIWVMREVHILQGDTTRCSTAQGTENGRGLALPFACRLWYNSTEAVAARARMRRA